MLCDLHAPYRRLQGSFTLDYWNINTSLSLPVFGNLKKLFQNLENRVQQLEASDILVEDCKHIAIEVQETASQNLLMAIEFYVSSEYISILQEMVVASLDMVNAAGNLDELRRVLNWSTSLAIRALGFALEARGTVLQSAHQDTQSLRDDDDLWRSSKVTSEKFTHRDLMYAC